MQWVVESRLCSGGGPDGVSVPVPALGDTPLRVSAPRVRKHLPTLCVWSLAYMALIGVGVRAGLQPILVFPMFFLLTLPPLVFCMRASRKVMNRTRLAFPEQWAALNRGMRLELRCFLFDERTFGDETIAAWKGELQWWMRAGTLALVLFLPTMLLIEKLSK